MYLSWLVWFGVFPIASDAFGKFKPYAIWTIASIIAFVSALYWIVGLSDGQTTGARLGPWPDLLLWAGSWPNQFLGQSQGEFHWYQLLTNTFLHADLMHLGGNMAFLLVFGQRINAVLGQWKTVVIYVALAVAASLVFYISMLGRTIIPALGASGAIMGLAGMYFILLPASRVHMVIWLRLGIILRLTKCFVVHGWGVLLFFIGWDVVATLYSWRDGTAHWAHLGGFICGAILALVLLLTRKVNMQGADIISVVLGRHAWKLLGKPAENAETA
jgi:membrane associated rhomboid family serine protease